MAGILNIIDIKIDWSNVTLYDPDDPLVQDGANGYLVEDILESHGFPISRNATTDLPGIEVKTKRVGNSCSWTIGRMTYADITRSDWLNASVRKKIQRQYQVLYAKNPITLEYKVRDARVVDFTHPVVQREIQAAYDNCRKQLITNGSNNHQTVKSGNYSFEYRPNKNGGGQSYSFRITTSGMNKLIKTISLLSTNMFEFS